MIEQNFVINPHSYGKKNSSVPRGEKRRNYQRLIIRNTSLSLRYFEKQFILAEETKLPLFLHNRNTMGDFLAMMTKHRDRFTSGVVHSFTGTLEEAEQLIDLGLFIGINGCSLKTEEQLEIVRKIPISHILIETGRENGTS